MTFEECCCFKCCLMTSKNDDPDCACECVPQYGDYCLACPKKSFCDVALNPELYP